jgi:hypothetical protein
VPDYVIWCDESDRKGKHYCDFYGGVLVEGSFLRMVHDRLQAVYDRHSYHQEAKWEKVTPMNLKFYMALMDEVFKLIREGRFKVRIMFRQTAHEPIGLSAEQHDLGFQLLYYQFIKHSFGLGMCCPERDEPVRVRFYFDRLPDTIEKNNVFKSYIHGLQSVAPFRDSGIMIAREDIVEVVSHDHIELQCVDVILGSMPFRLNNKHKWIPEGKKRRGKRTRAKEKLYKHINKHLRAMYSGFNIGESTGRGRPGWENLWVAPYRHWKFVPSQFNLNPNAFK